VVHEVNGPTIVPGGFSYHRKWIKFLLLAAFVITGCAGRRPIASSVPAAPAPESLPAPLPTPAQPAPAPIPGIYSEEGTASWYGIPFHGRRAADGEIFDMNTMVAAHRTLPFGSVIRVTNLRNGREAEVRIIDRGPFVEGRILDLAHEAAVALDMIGTGVAQVRIELLSGPSPTAGYFTVQVGAFTDRTNADNLRVRLLAKYQPIYIQDYDAPQAHFYRVRVGRVPSIDAAQKLAAQLRATDGFQTFVMRLDLPADPGQK
jgi:rare lipoprotein A